MVAEPDKVPIAADSGRSIPRIRTVMFAKHIPHYRTGLCRELMDCAALDIMFVRDPHVSRAMIPGASIAASDRDRHIRSISFATFTWQIGLLTLLRRLRPDVVIMTADYASLSTWLGAAYLKMTRTRVLFWTHGWLTPDRSRARSLVKRVFFSLSDGLLLYSKRGEQLAVEAGCNRDRVAVIYNSIDAGPPARHSASEQGTLNIGYSGRLTEAKRLDLLVAACAIAQQRGCRIRLHIIGEGPKRDHLEEATARFGVDTVFYGSIYSTSALCDVYSSIDLVVIPGPAGLSVIQAFGYGLPVAVPSGSRGQKPEWDAVVPGENGFHFEPTPSGLASMLVTFANLDDRARRRLRDEALRTFTDRLSPERQAARIEAAVVRVAGQRRGSVCSPWRRDLPQSERYGS